MAAFSLFYVGGMAVLQMVLTFLRSSKSELYDRLLDTFLTFPTPASYALTAPEFY
jgi:hypothetical protein